MKTQNIKSTPHYLVLVVLFISELCSAQPGFDDGDDVQDVLDVPEASIDNPIILLLLVGVIGSLYLLRKKIKKVRL